MSHVPIELSLLLLSLGQELVGNYNANFYSINGMVLETRKRREHLSKDDVQKNKALLENFATGNTSYLEDQQNNGKFILMKYSCPWQGQARGYGRITHFLPLPLRGQILKSHCDERYGH